MPLPYSYDALEPLIDAETLYYHHDKHLKTYVDNLNNIIKPYEKYHSWSLLKLLLNIDLLPGEIQTPVKNNGGGVFNHEMYFTLMTPNKTEPHGKILKDIEKTFGLFENFKQELKKTALGQFGSGYAWLVKNGGLKIIGKPNQDPPIDLNTYPLLPVDVWEHAYYLKYKNRRDKYFDSWFQLIDWNKLNDEYEQ